jgi:hypothetical protein
MSSVAAELAAFTLGAAAPGYSNHISNIFSGLDRMEGGWTPTAEATT